MDLDSLGPIVLFIVYMAISAWSKQKKAGQGVEPAEPKQPIGERVQKPMQEVGGILEQLKKELFEVDEEPLFFQQEEPVEILEEELPVPEAEPEPAPAPVFEEGSREHKHAHPPTGVMELEETTSSGQTLEEVLEPFSKVQQGIILHEILGKPRARQENDEWFHRS